MEIVELRWDEHNIAHIARHDVTPVEVEQVVFNDDPYPLVLVSERRRYRVEVWGATRVGRLLIAYLDVARDGVAVCVTCRAMTRREAAYYREETHDD